MIEPFLQFLLASALVALAAALALRLRDPLHPACLVTALWSVIGLLYLILPHSLFPLTLATSTFITLAAVAFAVGALAAGPVTKNFPVATPAWRTTVLRPMLYWASVLGLPLYVMRAGQLAAAADYTESLYINLRIAVTGELDDAMTFGMLAYLVPVSFTSTLVELAASRRRLFEPAGWLSLAVSLGYAVLSTGRTFALLLVVSVVFVAVLQRRIRASQAVWGGLLLVGAAFFGLGALANKIGVNVDETAARTALDALALYLFGSVAAFDAVLRQPIVPQWGVNVLRSPLAVLQSMGLGVDVVPLVKEYVFVPEPTNVYTVFLQYVRDFSWLGALPAFALIGAGQGALYRAARHSAHPRTVILCALAMYPLLMQFFQDQYFSLMTTWIVFAALVTGCFAGPRSPLSDTGKRIAAP